MPIMPGLMRIRRLTETRRQMFKKVVTVPLREALVVPLSTQVLLLLVLLLVVLLVLLRVLLTAPTRRVPRTRHRM